MEAALQHTDKIIWSYWHTEAKPPIVELAIQTWRKHNPEYAIHVLSEPTIGNYLNMNALPTTFARKMHCHKADIVRIALLEKYGGVWIDSSILINKPLSEEWDPTTYDVGGYYIQKSTHNINKPVFENWFISAPKNSALIKEWKNEVFRGMSYNSNWDYIRSIESTVNLQGITSKAYLLMHCAFLKVTQHKQYRIKAFKAEDGPFKYLCDFGWDSARAVEHLMSNTTAPVPDIIKLRSCERPHINMDAIRPGSILDRFRQPIQVASNSAS